MSDIAIRATGLGKMYRIGGERLPYRTMRATLVQMARRPLERIRHPGAATQISQDFWALRDVDLAVEQGENHEQTERQSCSPASSELEPWIRTERTHR